MKTQQSTWFIIVVYHADLIALQMLLSVLEDFFVIIVANSPLPVAKTSKVVLLQQKENIGYGGGANIGMRLALTQGAQWAVILNQDLVLTKETVKAITSQLLEMRPAIVGPFAGSFDTKRWTTVLPASKNIDYISGACMAIHRDVVEKIGFFYEPYFMYYEDADCSVRATRSGFPLQQIEAPGIKHDDTQTLGKGSALHEYYLARNHLLFLERQAPLGVKVHELLRLPKTFYEHMQDGNSGAVRGITDYLLRRFGRKADL